MQLRVLLLSPDGDPIPGYWAVSATEMPNIGAVIYVVDTSDRTREVRGARVSTIALEQPLPIVAHQTDK